MRPEIDLRSSAPRSGSPIWRTVLWLAVVAYLGVIFYLSSQPNPLPSLTSSVNDKILHGAEYGGLGALVSAALRASGARAWRAAVLGVVIASLYGASDEFHQWFVPGRSCDVLDWVADTVGAAAGAIAAARASWRRTTSRGG